MPGLCSATKYVKPSTSSSASPFSTPADVCFSERSEKACGLRDESRIPISLDSQQSLGASLDGGLQNGDGMYNSPALGNQANGEPQMKDQTYLDSNKDFIEAFPGDFPLTTAQTTIDSLQHDGWDSLPPLADSAPPIGRGPYLQGSPYAQALAAAAAPDANIESNSDFTDWRITT